MSHKKPFEFELGETARIEISGEQGEVVGRADYKHDQNYFLIRYEAANGTATSKFWGADALVKVNDPS